MSTQLTHCPDLETLSAWHDGELHDSHIEGHLQHCQHCQEVLRDFAAFDVEIQQHLDEAHPDPANIDRIIRRTRRRIERQPIQWLSLPVLSRLAACVALVAVCAVLFAHYQRTNDNLASMANATNDLTTPGDAEAEDASAFEKKLYEDLIAEFATATNSAAPATPSIAAEPALPPVAAAADTIVTRDNAGTTEGVLQLSNVSLVSLGSRRDFGPETPYRAPDATTRSIDDRVRHVWLVKDATAPLRELQKLMPEHERDFRKLINQNRDEYVLQLVISDRDLRDLVNHFSDLEFKLISPQAPQPGRDKPLRLNGKAVQYEMDFVRK